MKRFIVIILCFLALISCKKESKHAKHNDKTSNVYYTCSMDPQVMEKKPGKCPICKMELTPITLDDSKGLRLSEQQEKLANIVTMELTYDYIDSKVAATGIVKENEKNTSFINARIDGRIDKLFFKTNGLYINKGDILYEIYSEMLASTQSEFINVNKQLFSNPNDASLKSIMSAATSKLELWGLSQKQIEQLKTQTKPRIPYPIESTRSGYITNVAITEGAIVMEGQSLIELTEYKTLWIDAQFYPSETVKINKGNKVDIMVSGVTTDYIEGEVIQILPQVLSNSKINVVRILISSNFQKIKPGMQATIYWHNTSEKSLVVPSNAVLRDSKNSIVWIKKNGIYEAKMVHLGNVSEDKIAILHGLSKGDTVVISGSYLLQSEYIFKKGNSSMEGHDMSKM